MQKQEHAQNLALRGFRIFPLRENEKRPAIEGWQAEATTDPKRIAAWWRANPDYNVGIATGHGLLVLDFDVKKGGLTSLDALDMLGLPQGYRVRTPRGGVHVYLACPDVAGISVSVNALKDFPGVDVRCDGGLVAGEGSVVDGVEYAHL